MGLRDLYAKRAQKRWDSLSPEEQAAKEAVYAARLAANNERLATGLANADAAAERSRAEGQERLDAQVLGGPAGAHVWGTVPDLPKPSDAARTHDVRSELKRALSDLKDTAASLAKPMALLGIGSEFAPDVTNPVEREQIVAAERAARDEARRPYLAGDAASPQITRIATHGKTQFEELRRWLAGSGLGARPDLVYGAYRVPDRIDPKHPGTEAGRVVEWAIVHAPAHGLPAAQPPRRVRFDAEERWVSRRQGDPVVLDEDLAIAWLRGRGIGPEQCLGIAREVLAQRRERPLGSEETSNEEADVYVRVTGVSVLLHDVGAAPEPAAPVEVPFDGVDGTHVEVLNWVAVAAVVHPRPQRGPEVPSPFPYLPSTPQEVLVAYLEIVGVDPADCYGAAVATDRYFEVGEVTSLTDDQISLDALKFTDAPKLPCADGKPRRRLQFGSRIVISYRDSPAYEEGRERWAAYQRDVLFTRMHLQTEARRPIADSFEGLVGAGALRAVDRIERKFNALSNARLKEFAYDRYRDQTRYCDPLDG